MSKIDLSTMPAQELRQLLDSARQRGHAAQSYEILREMDARRSGLVPPLAKGRHRRARRGPRMIELQLGDPLEKFDEVFDDPLEGPDAEPPLTLAPAAPQPAPVASPPPARPRWGHWATLCFALGLGGGVAAGWWAADGGSWQPLARPALASAQPAAKRPPLPVEIASPAVVAAAPAAAAPAVPETQLASAADSLAAPAVATPSPPEPGPDAATSPPSPSPVTQAHAVLPRAEDRASETAASDDKACGGKPTPADAMICREPRLRRLQAELRQAYAEAMAAHRDRALLRQRQLAWRDGRNAVSSPDQLARLYLQRIEKLKAATAEAVRER